jgi:hypothetical protein
VLTSTLAAYDEPEVVATQDSSGDAGGTVYLLARELHRATCLLDAADRLHAAHPDDAASALAAAEAVLQAEVAMVDTVSDDQP